MKKVIILLLSLFMPVLVNADVYNYEDLTISVDESTYTVFTRDNLDNNSILQEYNIDKDTIIEEMTKKKIYIEGYDFDNLTANSQFVITIDDSNTEGNLTDYPESRIKTKTKFFREASNVTDSGIYKKNGYAFVYRTYKETTPNLKTYYFYEYYTVINGKDYNIFFSKTGSDFTEEEKNSFKSMIDTIKFNTKTSVFDGSVAYKLGYFTGILVVITAIIVVVIKFAKPKKKN